MADFFTAPTWVFNAAIPGDRANHSLFGRMKYCTVGYGVYRDASGAYHQVTDADDDVIKNSVEYYSGGRSYVLTLQQKNDLTAAGYGAYITASVPQ